jgi:hypothetical protein
MDNQVTEFSITLESFIDTAGLAATLEVLVEICHGKADHLRSNWQDERAAKDWERVARGLGKISLD